MIITQTFVRLSAADRSTTLSLKRLRRATYGNGAYFQTATVADKFYRSLVGMRGIINARQEPCVGGYVVYWS